MQLFLEYWRTPAVEGPEERADAVSVAAGRQPTAPDCVSNGTVRRSAVKTVSQGKMRPLLSDQCEHQPGTAHQI